MTAVKQFLPFALPDIGEAEIEAAVEAMRSGWLTSGPRVKGFEREFAEFLGGGVHAVALNSATAALHLALDAAGVRAGDEVLVPTWTFTATAEVVTYLGARPIVVDVDPTTLAIDLDRAEGAISPRTRAVIPVHFAGLGVDRARLDLFAKRHGLTVVEDAAHAFPAVSGGVPIGRGTSTAVAFSFYATKTMTTGEGGMMVTADEDVARRVRLMRLHGISRDVFDRYRSVAPSWSYEVVAPGHKYNLTDPAAAMGRVQLARAVAMRDRRAEIAARYSAEFAGLPVDVPADAVGADRHAWHLYVLRLRAEAGPSRDAFIDGMHGHGVGCSVHFIPLHRHPYWRTTGALREGDFPVAEREFTRVVSLPLSSGLTDDQVERVVETVHRVLG